MYACNSLDGSITAIDTGTNRGVATFHAGKDARRIVGTPDGKTIYVTTNETNHPVHVIDTATGKVRAKLVAGDPSRDTLPEALAVDSKNGILYVATEFGKPYVAKVEMSSNRVLERISIRWSASDIVVDAERNLVFVSSGHSILVIDASTDAVTATLPMGAQTSRLAYDPGTLSLYVVIASSKSIAVLDTTANRVTATVTLPSQPYAIAVDPVTHHVFATAKGISGSTDRIGEIHVLDATTATFAETLSAGNADVLGLSVDPSSHRLYVAAGEQNSIITFNRSSR
ncbi:YncE family protein [Nocardia huaxiensis]|uniref:YncE family protein n=1 Tax=Nocardia huaxiensis TaxID=2755382 RepID=UPI001C664005|nr:YncE family protein [Nocardia huaxiensis]